jgi:S-adenosylmethionine-dependent methyltransferase
LAAQGHHVLLVDYSAAMLADAQAQAAASGLQERVQLRQAELSSIGDLLAGETFDAVLCHNVIQYLDDAPALLGQLSALLRPGGLLSLVSMNRYSAVYAALLLHGDLSAAHASLDTRRARTIVFDAPLTIYSAEEAEAMLAAVGLAVTADYGLLCITAYWRADERKHDPAVYAQLEALELALMDKEPYKRLARSFQVIAHK